MTGTLRLRREDEGRDHTPTHTHALWTLRSKTGGTTLLFRDPRRFGGLRALPSPAALDSHWQELGPDALAITGDELKARLRGSRALKPTLLDQRVIAGVGNIYADEALFLAGIHPTRRVSSLRPSEIVRLADSIRSVLKASIQAGGTTLRDYADAGGRPGGFQASHRVYARGGLPCALCGTPLRTILLAQRSTTFCNTCQPVRTPKAEASTPNPHSKLVKSPGHQTRQARALQTRV